ncbi:helix-turn-helix domain-containing protein [Kineococcus sp. GCM10028916]|uniref:helix-turn-helix domain-containing protein n=1 Tax=Kineococcus sp. GCM10028916 TaxID=3273394 RepID=UPI003636FC30
MTTESPEAAGAREAARREQLLRVLYDTATDLSSLRDVDAVLGAIVRRTRSLLSTDMAYLSLNDDAAGETFIRMTDGVATAAYRNIRMPLGTGVLGSVATGNSPRWTRDYLADTSLSHLPGVDSSVAGEGVRAIMGVPLRVEGRVIGALLVAQRRPWDFSREDVSLVEAIGSHAAVALENARRFSAVSDALARLAQAQRENLEHVATLEALTAADVELSRALAEANPAQAIALVLGARCAGEVVVLDADGHRLAATSPDPAPDRVALRAAARDSARAGGGVAVPGGGEGLLVAATTGGDVLGALLLQGAPTTRERLLLERAATFLTAALLFQRALAESTHRQETEVALALLGPRAAQVPGLAARAARLGLDVAAGTVVSVVVVGPQDRTTAHAVARAVVPGGAGLVTRHEDHLCLLLPAGSPVPGRLRAALAAQGATPTIGTSRAVTSTAAVLSAHDEARGVVRAMEALGRSGEALDVDALGTPGVLLGLAGSAFARSLVRERLGPLLEHDERRGSDLTATAWALVGADGEVRAVASALNVHPNTVRQRMTRVGELLGEDWRRGPRALDVHVALTLWRLGVR